MPQSNKILTSLHGRKAGIGVRGNLIQNLNSDDKLGCVAFRALTATEMKGAFTTPVELVPAPAAGYAHIFKRMIVHMTAGTVFAGVAAGEDMCVKYTDNSGLQASGMMETTGFLDQATAQTRVVNSSVIAVTTTPNDFIPTAAAALVLCLVVGDITNAAADRTVNVRVEYDTIKLAVTA